MKAMGRAHAACGRCERLTTGPIGSLQGHLPRCRSGHSCPRMDGVMQPVIAITTGVSDTLMTLAPKGSGATTVFTTSLWWLDTTTGLASRAGGAPFSSTLPESAPTGWSRRRDVSLCGNGISCGFCRCLARRPCCALGTDRNANGPPAETGGPLLPRTHESSYSGACCCLAASSAFLASSASAAASAAVASAIRRCA